MRTEIPQNVEVVATNLRPISKQPSQRVRQPESLQRDFLFEQLKSQQVASTRIEFPNGDFSTIGTYNVISPYTTLDHVMLLDTTPAYTPTPTEMSQQEYCGLLDVAARVYAAMIQEDPDGVISLGYNNTPLNFGKPEMKMGGMQSLPTKHHLQEWIRPHDVMTVPFAQIPENVQAFLEGDSYTEFASVIAARLIPNPELFDSQSLHIDHSGLRVDLQFSLGELLSDSDGFARFIKELHGNLEYMNELVWNAVVEQPFQSFKDIAQQAFEFGYAGALDELEQSPILRSRPDRDARLSALPTAIFTPTEIATLVRLSAYMRNQSEAPEHDLTRKGWGYSLVFAEDLREQRTTLFLRPAIQLFSSRGGVVETQRQSLVRSTDSTNSAVEIEANIAHMKQLRHLIPRQIG